jgi:hypothetical protein
MRWLFLSAGPSISGVRDAELVGFGWDFFDGGQEERKD